MVTEGVSSSDSVLLPSAAAASDTINKALLKHHSSYFRGALSGRSKETDDSLIQITDLDTDAFDVFVNWMYRGTVKADLRLDLSGKHAFIASRSYILADRLIVPGLKSALMDTYFDLYTGPKPVRPRCCAITQLFCELPEQDPLLRLCVDVWSTRKTIFKLEEGEKADASNLPNEFLVRLMLRMNELGQKPPSLGTLKREDYNAVASINE